MLDKAGALCADVAVPLNYAEPQGRTITIAISRAPAADSAHRRGIMLSNPGGPGAFGLDFTVQLSQGVPTSAWRDYDLIGMDPRGMGRSTPVHCGWPVGDWAQSPGLDLAGFGKSVVTEADLAARCLSADDGTLPYTTTRNTARDMDVVRAVLGEDRLNYFGGSYGTYLGAVFGQMFPERVDRMILDSAVDPARYTRGMFEDMGVPTEAALDAWADWAAARNGEYHFGTTRSEVRAMVTDLIAQAARQPIRIGGYSVDEHWLPSLLAALDYPDGFDVLAADVRQFADAAAGAQVQPNPKLAEDLDRLYHTQPHGVSAEGQVAVLCGDVAQPRDPIWYWHRIEASRVTQPVFGPMFNNISPCAFWRPPVEPPTAVHNAVPAMILQSSNDALTTYQSGLGLHRAMTASRMVTLDGVMAHGVSFFPSTCVRQTVDAYLRSGAMPATDLTCRAD
ncbi:alpha/beta fold hydrolase [Nocardia terpenica]|uniref:alpha/beta fold hydrolase n=1 Tax=Nocardia terpenica TaxID=455432 RepID=UPI001EEA9FE8|nr:alpha/beta fold hydrolase [Nocardia terpenica]